MLVFAHRGASGYAPENTLPAFELGLKQRCDGFEFDVQITRDGVAAVIHDWTVDRTTNGSGEVRSMDYCDIRALDAGSWLDPRFAGTSVPRIEEIFELVPKGTALNVEIKSRPNDPPGLEELVASLIEKHDRLQNTIVSSFDHKSIKLLHRLNRDIKKGILYEGVLISPLSYGGRHGLGLYSLHPCHDYVDSKMVKTAHASGIKVACWTVNTAERARELREMGVDIAITNYPDRLLAETK